MTDSSQDAVESAPSAGPGTERRIVLGVSGGIAAYKACELLRRLRAAGYDVMVVATESALKFVGAATFEALSGHQVATDLFTDVPSVRHVTIGQQADLVLIAPATADLLARAATGRADDLLAATLLVTRAPVLMVPAMHTEMWRHPATEANVATLRQRGITVMPPAVGRLTGTDSGAGRLPEPEHIAQLAELLLHQTAARSPLPFDLVGRRILISAGGTREALDPVRFLGNRSSGRQGYAVALVAAARGAEVTLIAANTSLADPPGVTVQRVVSAADVQRAMTSAVAEGQDAVVMTAAVADFRPAAPADYKIKKTALSGPPAIDLLENPDILADLVKGRGAELQPLMVGFAAETGDGTTSPLELGRQKLARKGCDLLVVNRVDGARGFESDDNAGVILKSDGTSVEVPFGPKARLAVGLCDALVVALESILVTNPAIRIPPPMQHGEAVDPRGDIA